MKNRISLRLAAVVRALLLLTLSEPSHAQAPQVTTLSQSDVLPDGTPYGIVVPPNWNGTLLLDLDFLTSWRTPT